MVLNLAQTCAGREVRYQVERDGAILWEAELRRSIGRQSILLTRDGGTVYSMHSGGRPGRKAQSRRQIRPYGVAGPDGTPAGSIGLTRDGGFWKPCYYHLELNGREWSLYEVGLGKEGIKLPVWEGERQAALLEKDAVVRDNLDRYQLYAASERDLLPAVLLGLFYDCKQFEDRGERVVQGKSVTYLYTFSRATRERYDPAFRARCME